MSKTVELARHLETLHINNMYKNDFYWTWDKTDEELEAIFTVADALRDLRERNKSTRIFDSGLGISIFRDNSTRTRFSFASACNLLGLTVQDLDEKKSQITTAVAGVIVTLLAAAGILNSIQGFLSLLSAIVPALMGTMIADYWILSRGRAENFELREGFHAPGLVSFFAGALVACMTGGTFAAIPFLSFLDLPFFIGPVNGIVVSMLLYAVMAAAGGKRA